MAITSDSEPSSKEKLKSKLYTTHVQVYLSPIFSWCVQVSNDDDRDNHDFC